jgi:hypothetical protein
MAKSEKTEEKEVSGIAARLKKMLPGGSGLTISTTAGVVTAILFGGPFGVGVAGGVYAASKLKGGVGGVASKTKSIALKSIGGITSGACTTAGAAIGSMMFPIFGTILGAAAGFVIGTLASKKVTAKIRDSYMEKAVAGVEKAGKYAEEAAKKAGKDIEKAVSPNKTPAKKQVKSSAKGK